MANRAPTLDPKVFSIRDLIREGSSCLPPVYRGRHTYGEKQNEEAFDRYKIRPRVLRNVSQVDTSAKIFGYKASFPCGFAPSGIHKLAHPDGEIATSRAATKIQTAMAVSSYATASLEDVKAEGADNPYMIQMTMVKDRNITLQLLRRAEDVGFKAVFLSVDTPVLGRRLGEMQNKFSLPQDLGFPNMVSTGRDEFDKGGGPSAFDDTLEWDEIIPWLREHTAMEIWLKGITSPEDVEKAVSTGVDGVIISNHGGRQLDGMPATLDALRQCAPVARGHIQIAMDGGIRRGSDIFKALALGAQFCFVGRIPIWGLAYKGQAGVELGMEILLSEFRVTMALAGCRSIKDITGNHLTYLDSNGLLAKL
ncbi:MAG: hypothetical protein Q9222_005934 [Ikaeria aurantiellina]